MVTETSGRLRVGVRFRDVVVLVRVDVLDSPNFGEALGRGTEEVEQ